MFKDTPAFSSFSVNDIAAAKAFYAGTLGLPVSDMMGQLSLSLAGGGQAIIYAKPDHAPATYTVLNFRVTDIKKAVAALSQRGVTLEHYPELTTDDQGMLHDARGPFIAWFKDPAGNILSLMEER